MSIHASGFQKPRDVPWHRLTMPDQSPHRLRILLFPETGGVPFL